MSGFCEKTRESSSKSGLNRAYFQHGARVDVAGSHVRDEALERSGKLLALGVGQLAQRPAKCVLQRRRRRGDQPASGRTRRDLHLTSVIRTALAFVNGYLTICLLLIISPLILPLSFLPFTYGEPIDFPDGGKACLPAGAPLPAGASLNPLGNGPPMPLLNRESLQYQKIKSSLNQIARFSHTMTIYTSSCR